VGGGSKESSRAGHAILVAPAHRHASALVSKSSSQRESQAVGAAGDEIGAIAEFEVHALSLQIAVPLAPRHCR
jgi:hypothetical protein